jgi:20S proteasome alpha/beta subunit
MQNHLRRKPIRPKRKPVTVIIGIICKASIVLASDSQTTYGDYSKRCDTEKIRVVGFKNKKVFVDKYSTV